MSSKTPEEQNPLKSPKEKGKSRRSTLFVAFENDLKPMDEVVRKSVSGAWKKAGTQEKVDGWARESIYKTKTSTTTKPQPNLRNSVSENRLSTTSRGQLNQQDSDTSKRESNYGLVPSNEASVRQSTVAKDKRPSTASAIRQSVATRQSVSARPQNPRLSTTQSGYTATLGITESSYEPNLR